MTSDANSFSSNEVSGPDQLSWRILEAVSYLEQCLRAGRGFGILTGSSTDAVSLAINRFLQGAATPLRTVRVPAPTDSSHLFLEAILSQLGFDPFESTADDLQRLLTVVFRQETGHQAPICLIIENAQEYGPRVFETIRELARESRDAARLPLFILAGSSALNRVLDSRGMASIAEFTRLRFDIATAPAAVPAPAMPAVSRQEVPELVLSLYQQTLQRFPIDGKRLLIGRGQHCDICIHSRFTSRQHALLIRSADGDWVVDLKSTNGTSVNSQVISQHRLNHGDVISIGNHRLLYRNPTGRWVQAPALPGHDQLSETMVMRSLHGVTAGPKTAAVIPDRKPSAA